MTKTLATEIEIAAPPERVWQVLSDLHAYGEWNPFIVQATGQAVVGARLTLRMQPTTGKERTLRPTVTEVREGELLRWIGRLVVPGLMDVEHTFFLEPAPGNGTRVHQGEDFRGLLVPLVARTLDRGTLPAFEAMNEALKRRVEESMSSQRG
jgi:hypothetical protein